MRPTPLGRLVGLVAAADLVLVLVACEQRGQSPTAPASPPIPSATPPHVFQGVVTDPVTFRDRVFPPEPGAAPFPLDFMPDAPLPPGIVQ